MESRLGNLQSVLTFLHGGNVPFVHIIGKQTSTVLPVLVADARSVLLQSKDYAMILTVIYAFSAPLHRHQNVYQCLLLVRRVPHRVR